MWFTSPHMIHGWFTELPYTPGQGGTRIPESGMAARTSRSESVSESASSAASDGVGLIGDSIGITDTQFITTIGTIRAATRFTTAAIITEEEARAAELTGHSVELVPRPMQEIGLQTGTPPGAARVSTVLAQRPGLSTATPRLLEDMLNPAVRPAPARGPSAAIPMVDKQEAIRHAEARASAAEQRVAAVADLVVAVADLAAVVADIGNRSCVLFLVDREI